MYKEKKRFRKGTQAGGFQVFHGAQEVIERVIALIAAAGAPQQEGEILLTFQGAPDVFNKVPRLREDWWCALQTAAEQGWKVTHLIRISDDPDRIFSLAGDIAENIRAGSDYTAYYLRQYGVLSPPYDILVVPGQGAMHLFATEQPDYVDTAVYTTDPAFTQALSNHFRQLLTPSKVSPLIKMHPAGTWACYEVMRDIELEPGERFLVQHELSAITRPLSWHTEESEWAQAHKAFGIDPSDVVELFSQRAKAFEKQVDVYSFRDIGSKRAVERQRDYGESTMLGVFYKKKEERIARLKEVIRILKENPNYELALVEETEEHLLPKASWEVKPQAVILDALPHTEGNIWAQLEITEPKVVQGFRDYFTYLWNSIKEENRNRDKIIEWLEDQVAYIEL
jgi:hypothetical protein